MVNDNPNDHVGVGYSFDLFVIGDDGHAVGSVTRWPYDPNVSLEDIALRFARDQVNTRWRLGSMGNPDGDIVISAKATGGYFRRFTFRFDWQVTPVLVKSEP